MAVEFSPRAAPNFPTGGHLFSPLVATNLPTNGSADVYVGGVSLRADYERRPALVPRHHSWVYSSRLVATRTIALEAWLRIALELRWCR